MSAVWLGRWADRQDYVIHRGKLAYCAKGKYYWVITATLSTSQSELPRLVEIASLGEDVVITVEGKPKARLTRVDQSEGNGSIRQSPVNLSVRIQELASLRNKFHTGKPGLSVDQILDASRADQP